MENRFSWDTFTIMSNIFPGYYFHIKRMSSMKVMKMARFKTMKWIYERGAGKRTKIKSLHNKKNRKYKNRTRI